MAEFVLDVDGSEEAAAHYERGYLRGLEKAAVIAELAPYNRKAMICGCSEGLANWIASKIREER